MNGTAALEPEGESEPETDSEPEGEAAAEPEGGPAAEPEGESTDELAGEPSAEPVAEPSPEFSALPDEEFDSAAAKYQAAAGLINDALSGYLSAVGLVFGLLIAQLYAAVNKRMEHMRDFVTAEAGLLHRSVCTIHALQGPVVNVEEERKRDKIGDHLVRYSSALQLEFKDKENLRWTHNELMRRRTEDLNLLQEVIECATAMLAHASNDGVKACAHRIISIADELITLRYKRSAEMQQRVLTLTVSTQVCTYHARPASFAHRMATPLRMRRLVATSSRG